MRLMMLALVLGALWGSSGAARAQAQAQSGGQFCMRAFEDTNGNGRFDPPAELLISRGIVVNLLDARSVTIASALLDDSPTAGQGVVCFTLLPPGQYSLSISAAEFRPTTPALITTSITADTLPTVVEFGAQRLAPAAAVAQESQGTSAVLRAALAAGGALIAMLAMALLGLLVYLLAFGRRPARTPAAGERRPPTSRSLPAVDLDETGEHRAV